MIFFRRAVLDFLSHTVTTNMDSLSTSFDTIYFPAITISLGGAAAVLFLG